MCLTSDYKWWWWWWWRWSLRWSCLAGRSEGGGWPEPQSVMTRVLTCFANTSSTAPTHQEVNVFMTSIDKQSDNFSSRVGSSWLDYVETFHKSDHLHHKWLTMTITTWENRCWLRVCVAGRGDLAVLWFSDLLPRSWGFVPCLVGTAVHTQSTKLRIVSKITPHPPSHAAILWGV